jgi:Mn2+/Fe2+ NRAMP family transporter
MAANEKTPIAETSFAAASVPRWLRLPATIIILLRLTTDRKFMGKHVNGWFVNTVLVFSAVASLYLGYQSLVETFGGSG